MSANIQEVYSSNEALAAVIEATKAHQKKYNLTLMNAFEQKLHSNYNFAQIWYEKQWTGEKYYTWEQYKSFFYNYITGIYPTLPTAIKCYLLNNYKPFNYPKTPDPDVFKIIKEQLEVLAEYELKEKQELEQIEHETTEIRRILMHQNLTPALEYIEPFLRLEEAGILGKPEMRGKTALLIEMFNYGFILGKRTERARKHSKSS